MNISEVARKTLAKYPYIEEYMRMGVINHRALARAIIKDVKKELGGEVNFQSVVSAVRRYPLSEGSNVRGDIVKILARSEVNLRYDVVTLTLEMAPEVAKNLEGIRKMASENFIMIQGIETITVVGSEKMISYIESKVGKGVIESKKGLASVVVKSPKEIAGTPGVIAFLANVLALEGINVVEMMSSYTETCFIVEEKNALRTIETIRGEIKRART